MQERARKTRARILEAATKLFSARGFNGATIDEIAALADVNKQRIYAYFGSKNRLFEAALYPANTGYYYFYSNIDTKQTYFAKTLEEHNANQQKVAAEQGLSTETGTDGEENEAETETSGDEEGDEQ